MRSVTAPECPFLILTKTQPDSYFPGDGAELRGFIAHPGLLNKACNRALRMVLNSALSYNQGATGYLSSYVQYLCKALYNV